MRIERIRRTRTAPQSTSYMEVCVTFSTVDDRDYISSRSFNLSSHIDKYGKPQAGIRMEIPGFLMSTFKDLNTYGGIAKRTYGKDLRKYVKFDDEEMSLFLEIRLPNSTNWLQITPTRAKELMGESAEGELMSMQSRIRRARASSEGDVLLSSTLTASLQTDYPQGSGHSQRSASTSWQPPPRSPSISSFRS